MVFPFSNCCSSSAGEERKRKNGRSGGTTANGSFRGVASKQQSTSAMSNRGGGGGGGGSVRDNDDDDVVLVSLHLYEGEGDTAATRTAKFFRNIRGGAGREESEAIEQRFQRPVVDEAGVVAAAAGSAKGNVAIADQLPTNVRNAAMVRHHQQATGSRRQQLTNTTEALPLAVLAAGGGGGGGSMDAANCPQSQKSVFTMRYENPLHEREFAVYLYQSQRLVPIVYCFFVFAFTLFGSIVLYRKIFTYGFIVLGILMAAWFFGGLTLIYLHRRLRELVHAQANRLQELAAREEGGLDISLSSNETQPINNNNNNTNNNSFQRGASPASSSSLSKSSRRGTRSQQGSVQLDAAFELIDLFEADDDPERRQRYREFHQPTSARETYLRHQFRDNAAWHEFVLTLIVIANLGFIIALQGSKGTCNYLPEARRWIDCRASIMNEGLMNILLLSSVFLTPIRWTRFVVVAVGMTIFYFVYWRQSAPIRLDPTFNTVYASTIIMYTVQVIIGIVYVFIREYQRREEFEIYVARHLTASVVSRYRRETKRMLSKYVPDSFVDEALKQRSLEPPPPPLPPLAAAVVSPHHHQSSLLSLITTSRPFGFGHQSIVCCFALEHYSSWAEMRNACSVVEMLSRVMGCYDRLRALFHHQPVKYHAIGDVYVLMETERDREKIPLKKKNNNINNNSGSRIGEPSRPANGGGGGGGTLVPRYSANNNSGNGIILPPRNNNSSNTAASSASSASVFQGSGHDTITTTVVDLQDEAIRTNMRCANMYDFAAKASAAVTLAILDNESLVLHQHPLCAHGSEILDYSARGDAAAKNGGPSLRVRCALDIGPCGGLMVASTKSWSAVGPAMRACVQNIHVPISSKHSERCGEDLLKSKGATPVPSADVKERRPPPPPQQQRNSEDRALLPVIVMTSRFAQLLRQTEKDVTKEWQRSTRTCVDVFPSSSSSGRHSSNDVVNTSISGGSGEQHATGTPTSATAVTNSGAWVAEATTTSAGAAATTAAALGSGSFPSTITAGTAAGTIQTNTVYVFAQECAVRTQLRRWVQSCQPESVLLNAVDAAAATSSVHTTAAAAAAVAAAPPPALRFAPDGEQEEEEQNDEDDNANMEDLKTMTTTTKQQQQQQQQQQQHQPHRRSREEEEEEEDEDQPLQVDSVCAIRGDGGGGDISPIPSDMVMTPRVNNNIELRSILPAVTTTQQKTENKKNADKVKTFQLHSSSPHQPHFRGLESTSSASASGSGSSSLRKKQNRLCPHPLPDYAFVCVAIFDPTSVIQPKFMQQQQQQQRGGTHRRSSASLVTNGSGGGGGGRPAALQPDTLAAAKGLTTASPVVGVVDLSSPGSDPNGQGGGTSYLSNNATADGHMHVVSPSSINDGLATGESYQPVFDPMDDPNNEQPAAVLAGIPIGVSGGGGGGSSVGGDSALLLRQKATPPRGPALLPAMAGEDSSSMDDSSSSSSSSSSPSTRSSSRVSQNREGGAEDATTTKPLSKRRRRNQIAKAAKKDDAAAVRVAARFKLFPYFPNKTIEALYNNSSYSDLNASRSGSRMMFFFNGIAFILSTAALLLIASVNDLLTKVGEFGNPEGMSLWIVVCFAFTLMQLLFAIILSGITDRWRGAIVTPREETKLVSLRSVLISVSSAGAFASYTIAVWVAPEGTVIGNSHCVWMFVVLSASLMRSHVARPLIMWLVDVLICVAFLFRTLFRFHMDTTLRDTQLYIEALSIVYCLVARSVLDGSRRLAFATDTRITVLEHQVKDEVVNLTEAYALVAPGKVITKLVAQARGSQGWVSAAGQARYTTASGFIPVTGRDYLSTCRDAPFCVLDLTPTLRPKGGGGGGPAAKAVISPRSSSTVRPAAAATTGGLSSLSGPPPGAAAVNSNNNNNNSIAFGASSLLDPSPSLLFGSSAIQLGQIDPSIALANNTMTTSISGGLPSAPPEVLLMRTTNSNNAASLLLQPSDEDEAGWSQYWSVVAQRHQVVARAVEMFADDGAMVVKTEGTKAVISVVRLDDEMKSRIMEPEAHTLLRLVKEIVSQLNAAAAAAPAGAGASSPSPPAASATTNSSSTATPPPPPLPLRGGSKLIMFTSTALPAVIGEGDSVGFDYLGARSVAGMTMLDLAWPGQILATDRFIYNAMEMHFMVPRDLPEAHRAIKWAREQREHLDEGRDTVVEWAMQFDNRQEIHTALCGQPMRFRSRHHLAWTFRPITFSMTMY